LKTGKISVTGISVQIVGEGPFDSHAGRIAGDAVPRIGQGTRGRGGGGVNGGLIRTWGLMKGRQTGAGR